MGRNTIATIATKYCFYCSGGWMGGNTITIVSENTTYYYRGWKYYCYRGWEYYCYRGWEYYCYNLMNNFTFCHAGSILEEIGFPQKIHLFSNNS